MSLNSGIAVTVPEFLLSLGLTALLMRLAPRWGLVDQPDERKTHSKPTALGGGLAIYVALVLAAAALALFEPLETKLWVVLGAGFLLVLVGLLDDRFGLPWQLRLGAHFGVAMLVLLAEPPDGALEWIVALLWIVGLINAFNMLDNMDLLAGGTAALAAVALTLIESARADLLFLGAVAGFLWFNRSPARIFMGDAGSTFLGLYLGARTLPPVAGGEPIAWAVPVCVLAVPWYDLLTVVQLRLAQGRSPFHADRQHLSHRLVDRGLSKRQAVGFIHLLAGVSGLAGVVIAGWPEWSTAALAGFGGLWAMVIRIDWYGGLWHSRSVRKAKAYGVR